MCAFADIMNAREKMMPQLKKPAEINRQAFFMILILFD